MFLQTPFQISTNIELTTWTATH